MANLLVCDGDSLTVCGSASSSDRAWPIQAKYAFSNRWTVTNIAIAGQALTTMSTNAAANVDTLYNAGNAKNICAIWGGTNDIKLNSVSGATTYSNYVTYCQNRKNAGWQVLAFTIIARENNASFETERGVFNTSLRANWANYADALVDIAGISVFGANAAVTTNTAYYFSDGIHLSDAGYERVIRLVRDALVSLGAVVPS